MRISLFKLINIVLILSLFSTLGSALFEDQIGKFDWYVFCEILEKNQK